MPRKRAEKWIQKDKNNVGALSIEWAENAKALLFSGEITSQKDVIFLSKELADKIKKVEDFQGETVGAHRGYFFNFLKENPKIERLDVDSELQLIRMFEKKRIKALVGNENVIKFLIREEKMDIKNFITSDIEVGNVPYRFAFNKENKELRDQVDKEIKKLKKEGVIQKIINSYIGN